MDIYFLLFYKNTTDYLQKRLITITNRFMAKHGVHELQCRPCPSFSQSKGFFSMVKQPASEGSQQLVPLREGFDLRTRRLDSRSENSANRFLNSLKESLRWRILGRKDFRIEGFNPMEKQGSRAVRESSFIRSKPLAEAEGSTTTLFLEGHGDPMQ
jgi:hypothetical protein